MIKNAIKHLSNLPGWRTNRKIVVIESDDWGSIRMPSKEVFEKSVSKGFSLDKGGGAHYNKYDTLASSEDLQNLFEVLHSFKGGNGNPAVLTAVSLVANPNFDKIKADDFQNYHFEPFTDTLKRYNKENAFSLWKEGEKNHVFYPEFHGREHLNVPIWMRSLREKDKEALLAFDHKFWGYARKPDLINFQAPFDLEKHEDLETHKQIIDGGLKLFEEIHGRKAQFFVPPNGFINNELEKIAADNRVRFISTPKIQREVFGEGKMKKHFRYLGKKNSHGQIYITRNAFFEPSSPLPDQINSCLSEIEIAFKYKKPAVISSHRVNYIGGLDVTNRDRGLKALRTLLKEVVKKWPEVEFMTSSQLGELI